MSTVRSALLAYCCFAAALALAAPPPPDVLPHQDFDLGRKPVSPRAARNQAEAPPLRDTATKAYLIVTLTPEEKKLLFDRARTNKKSISAWARLVLLEAAAKRQGQRAEAK